MKMPAQSVRTNWVQIVERDKAAKALMEEEAKAGRTLTFIEALGRVYDALEGK